MGTRGLSIAALVLVTIIGCPATKGVRAHDAGTARSSDCELRLDQGSARYNSGVDPWSVRDGGWPRSWPDGCYSACDAGCSQGQVCAALVFQEPRTDKRLHPLCGP